MSDRKLYRPLPEGYFIRLLKLEPGVISDPIQVHLSPVNLYEAPPFEALSYTWGDLASAVQITCDGQLFDITFNLHSALLRIRHADCSRTLWADAICINQHDFKERENHVTFMGRIYERAEKVLIHLGRDEDGHAKDVKELVEQVSGMIEKYERGAEVMPVLDMKDPLMHDLRWRYLVNMLQCRWFTRAWVVQEVGLARDPRVLYGDVEFSYRNLTGLAVWQHKCAPQLTAEPGLDFNTIHIEWLDWSTDVEDLSEPPTRTFLELMNQASWLGCSDHRDHIYSLLGHPLAQLPGEKGLIVKPNYQKPAPEVYYELAMQLLQLPWGMRVLSAVEHDEMGPSSGFPSWVPLWTQSITMCNLGIFPGFYFNTSGGLNEAPPLTMDDHTLYLRGVALDVVVQTFQFSEQDMNFSRSDTNVMPQSDTLEVVWNMVVNPDTSSTCAYQERIEALSLTLTAGLTGYDPADIPENIAQHRANFAAYWELRTSSSSSSQSRLSSGDAEKFWVDMRLVSSGRSFFMTRKGYFGLGPCATRVGDECIVLVGAKVPFIVREAPQGKGFKQLIGECYVHGVMRGEIGEWVREGKVGVEDILLC